MRKTSILFIIAALFFISAAHPRQGWLDTAVQKIRQLPEAEALLREIEQEGPIRFALIEDHEASKFGAFWDLEARVIAVNPSFHHDIGSMIGSILFEMQNAKASKEFDALFDQAQAGLIAKEPYVRAIEHIEYLNSKRASVMAEKGIQQGLFHRSATLPTYNSFEEHYYYQQYGGHSHQIGIMYDRISPARSRNG